MPPHSQWPSRLSDKEAAERLRAIVLAACDGVRDITNDRNYKQLRSIAIGRTDLADVIPSFVRSQRDLTLLWNHLKTVGRRDRRERRAFVTEAFQPLVDRVEGRTVPPVASSRWTGRRTVKQQAQVVLTLGPTAFQAVDMLLDEQESPLHNGGPVEHERLEAIAQLKDLHAALGELIALAQAGRPFESQLHKVRALKDRAFQWSKDTCELMLAQSPLMASGAVYGSAIWFLINTITKDLSSSATMAGAIVAGGSVIASKRASTSHQ